MFDFYVYKSGLKVGYIVKYAKNPRLVLRKILDISYQASFEINEGEYDSAVFVWVVSNEADAKALLNFVSQKRMEKMPTRISHLVGTMTQLESDELEFIPIGEFSYDEVTHLADNGHPIETSGEQ